MSALGVVLELFALAAGGLSLYYIGRWREAVVALRRAEVLAAKERELARQEADLTRVLDLRADLRDLCIRVDALEGVSSK